MAQERYRTTPQRPNRQGPKTAPAANPPRPAGKKPRPKSAAQLQEERLQARRRRRLHRQRRLQLMKVSFLVSLVMVALYWAYVALSIVNRPDGTENALPLMIFTEGEREDDSTLEIGEVFFNGAYYLPVTELEPYMAISQFGDHKTRSFLLCGSEEYATFTLGSPAVEINGVETSLKENSFLLNDVLYIPMDFFTDKMNCFTFTESAPLAAKVLTFNESVTPAFRFHSDSAPARVDPATVPVAPVLPAEPAV